ncbi:PTS sugar transporter subunit IIA [Butyricicoccus sp.]|uniref:PTS sugar transporter subunit IIA n=1 Tax=Butyricicoccus sp. TaxID=2049021 RepID=UPI003F18A4F1
MARNKYLVIHGSASSDQEAISLCGNALMEAGLVGKSFIEKCLERETEYPTGLPTDIPTAIPHCKDDSITENSICFLKLEQPVTFRRMDDDEESVETDMIFNMAIKDPNEHLEALQNLMEFLGDSEALEQCRALSDAEVVDYLQTHIG